MNQRGSKDRIVQVYVYALQRCLMAHVDVLVEKGVDPVLESIVRQIWFRTLDVTRCLEPGVMHRTLQLYSPLTSYASFFGSLEARERELMSEDKISDHSAAFTACLYRLLDMDVIVWVLYAALVWMHEAITPLDIASWIERGELPFLKLPRFQEMAEARFRVYLPPYVFDPKKPPRPLGIEAGAAQLARDIGLKLPPINIPLYIERLSRILELPEDMAQQAIALYSYYWRGSGLDQEQSLHHGYPQMIPSSCILAVMKLTYGLDDGQRAIEGNQDWIEWSQKKWMESAEPYMKHSLVAKRLLEMSPSDLLEATRRIDAFLFEGHDMRKGYATVMKELQNLVRKWDFEEQRLLPVPKRPRTLGVEFGMGDKVTYIPSLYTSPYPLYWFNHFNGHARSDAHYPLDYTAVVSVLSGISNVQPGHLNACLATLEEQMKRAETACIQHLTSDSLKFVCEISPTFEKTALSHALLEMDFKSHEAEKIVAQESHQVKSIRKLLKSGGVRKRSSEEHHVMEAVDHCWKRGKKRSLIRKYMQIPFIGLNSSERSAELNQWTANPAELLRQARLAQRIGQPIVSLGTKRSLYHNLCISHARRAVNAASSDTFLSDIEPIEDDDVC